MNKLVIIYTLVLSTRLIGDGLGNQTITQDYPMPKGWVPNPRIAFDNDHPPVIYVEQGDTTNITFPKEVAKCKESSSLFVVTELGSSNTYEIDITISAAAVEKLKAKMERRKKSIYDATFTNLNCRFKNGKLGVLRLKLWPYPYYTVVMFIRRQTRDYSVFYDLEKKPEKSPLRKAPYSPPREKIKSSVADRNFDIFIEMLGDNP